MKTVARDAGDVFLDQRVVVDEVDDVVRREQVLEFEAVDARGVGLLDVEVVVVVVEVVHHADAERLGVAEHAVVDALDVEMAHRRHVAVGLEQRVDLGEARVDLAGEAVGS